MSPRRRPGRGLVIGIAAIALVVLGAGIALAVWLTMRGDSPEAGAQRYLDSLASGDADEVRATLTAGAIPDAATLNAFEAATAYLTQPRVEGAEAASADTASVSASYLLAGEMRTVSFTVRQIEGRWLADTDAVGEIVATTSIGDAVTIGDVVLEASAPFVALPASYAVSAAPARILTGTTNAVAAPGASTEVAVDAALSPDAAASTQPALDAYLETCTASSPEAPASTSPKACGISIPWGADLASTTGFVFRIETLPTVALDETGGFLATDGSYVVTVSGLTRDGDPGSFTYRDDAWTLRGALTFAGGELVLEAW
jgi:hypothetical protein